MAADTDAFQQLSDAELATLGQLGVRRAVAAGEYLYRESDNREALPGRPPNTTGELPLCDDKLLTKKRVLRDQVYAAANEIRGHPGNEPKKVDHVSVLHCLRADGICSQDGREDCKELRKDKREDRKEDRKERKK